MGAKVEDRSGVQCVVFFTNKFYFIMLVFEGQLNFYHLKFLSCFVKLCVAAPPLEGAHDLFLL